MKRIIRGFRLSLRKFFIAAGITTMPFLAHAGYSMREPGPESYTVPVQGRVISEETGMPIEGIQVTGDYWSETKTDSDGHFSFYLTEADVYRITFKDPDGFDGGGFFTRKSMDIPRENIEDLMNVTLFRESDVSDIHGVVLSEETGEPVQGIEVEIFLIGADNSWNDGFQVISGKDGSFSIRVPRRDSYVLQFSDTNSVFRWKRVNLTAREIVNKLKVNLTLRESTNTKK